MSGEEHCEDGDSLRAGLRLQNRRQSLTGESQAATKRDSPLLAARVASTLEKQTVCNLLSFLIYLRIDESITQCQTRGAGLSSDHTLYYGRRQKERPPASD